MPQPLWPRQMERGPLYGPLSVHLDEPIWLVKLRQLAQIAAKALDALAGILEIARLGRVGNPERRAKPERRTLHHGNALGFQELGDKAFVVLDHIARWRGPADRARTGRIDIERTLRPRTVDALGLVEHADHEIAPFLEHLVVRRDKVLRTVERLDRCPLRDRRRVRGRLRLDGCHRLD